MKTPKMARLSSKDKNKIWVIYPIFLKRKMLVNDKKFWPKQKTGLVIVVSIRSCSQLGPDIEQFYWGGGGGCMNHHNYIGRIFNYIESCSSTTNDVACGLRIVEST